MIPPGSAIASAAGQASQIAHRWGSPVNRENRAEGGYCWSTYKVCFGFWSWHGDELLIFDLQAICRRNGVYANAQGPHVRDILGKPSEGKLKRTISDLV